jgi:hypothetical protein
MDWAPRSGVAAVEHDGRTPPRRRVELIDDQIRQAVDMQLRPRESFHQLRVHRRAQGRRRRDLYGRPRSMHGQYLH